MIVIIKEDKQVMILIMKEDFSFSLSHISSSSHISLLHHETPTSNIVLFFLIFNKYRQKKSEIVDDISPTTDISMIFPIFTRFFYQLEINDVCRICKTRVKLNFFKKWQNGKLPICCKPEKFYISNDEMDITIRFVL